MHSEGTRHPDGRHEGRYGERAETHLRLLTEAALRSPADEDITRVERAAWACGLAVPSGRLVVAVTEPGYPQARVLALPDPAAEPIATMVRAAGDSPAGLPAWQVVEG